ncbi:S-formylglutathione hydrolase [Indioceanicola profundi]|uniref:S-formylglutathione hydrolase n=1 Tax=Indioceanicola profundi TaxID=2220096 RepID=UPI000E6AC780|nr:S-formylglutathione hydrolase [Indioceanicola profundi]
MADTSIQTLSRHRCYGGWVSYHQHDSAATKTPMKFGVFVPPQAEKGKVPVVIYLAGLTCDETTFLIKAGAERMAAELGIMLIAPDTSPRGLDLPGIRDSWDFGEAAGFYLNATRAPWTENFRMEAYVTGDLLEAVEAEYPNADLGRLGIMGHSMGGHGALTLALRYPDRFKSVSALAPISNPTQVPWGEKAFSNYLGHDRSKWAEYDASELVKSGKRFPGPVLVDQGLADKFLEDQLKPEALEAACGDAGQELTVRRHEGYDHGYFFIQTVIDDHLKHHASKL